MVTNEKSISEQVADQNQMAAASQAPDNTSFELMKKLVNNGIHIFEKAEHFTSAEIHDLAHWMHEAWVATRGTNS